MRAVRVVIIMSSGCGRQRDQIWWALLDSNQRPRDSGLREFPRSPDYLITFGLAVQVSGAHGGH